MKAPIDIAGDGNLFPREDILEAVAQSDWRDQPVPAAAWLVTAIGAVALAAGLPIARIFLIRQPTEFAAEGAGLWSHPLHALAAAIGRPDGFGLGIEATFFLLSALGLGLAFLATGFALRVMGFHGRLILGATGLTLAAPVVLAHGRLPSDLTFGILGAAITLAAAAAPVDPGRKGAIGYGLRLAVALGFAFFLRADILFAVPALALAGWTRTTESRAWAALPVTVLGVGLLAQALTAAPSLFGGHAGVLDNRWIDLALIGGPVWLLALGAWSHDEEELPPPLWLFLWLVGAVAATAVGRTGAPAMVVPVLAALAANTLARRARPDGALKVAAFGLLLQLVPSAALLLHEPQTKCFAATTAGDTRPGDRLQKTIIACFGTGEDSDSEYLLKRRLGLQIIPVGVPVPDADQGRTLVFPLKLGDEMLHIRSTAEYLSIDFETGKITPRDE